MFAGGCHVLPCLIDERSASGVGLHWGVATQINSREQFCLVHGQVVVSAPRTRDEFRVGGVGSMPPKHANWMIARMHELLTNAQMAEADRMAVKLGVPSFTLMENAGRAVADEAVKMVDRHARVAVLCGPGNNGGDGFVAARLLKERGYEVRVFCTAPAEALKGDAGENAKRWIAKGGRIEDTGRAGDSIVAASLVIDALFGAGLARGIDGEAAQAIFWTMGSRSEVLAVDVPSGLSGDTGAPVGNAVVRADRTVTFFRRKPGHLLFPGRELCGEVVLADIGIPSSALDEIRPLQFANAPELWLDEIPWPLSAGHKYGRGHVVVVSGPAHATGAARLGARGALRIGGGLVTVVGSAEATLINAAHSTAVMVHACAGAAELSDFLEDKRLNAVLIGPGLGHDHLSAALIGAVLASPAAVVLDADALTQFAGNRETLFSMIVTRGVKPTVMTPHAGEFQRLFGGLADGASKLECARSAAKSSGAHVVLKGADTVIAAPDGRSAINENAPAWLATAGSGDVLAGFITGLLAQGMEAFDAACTAVWVHGECASRFGPGLIAEDLSEIVPLVLRDLYQQATASGGSPGRRRAATVAREGVGSRAGEAGEA